MQLKYSKRHKNVKNRLERIQWGLAAAALYLSCVQNGVSITQRDLAEAAGVTEVTIRNRFKGLKEAKILESDF